MRGAGGSQGGEWQFLIGIVMMIAGFYLLFNAIAIETRFGLGMRLYGIGGVGITSGMLMIPFMGGIVSIFYKASNPIGWLLSVGSLIAMVVGVLANSQFSFRAMSAFDLIIILVLAFGGLGLFLKSLKHNPL